MIKNFCDKCDKELTLDEMTYWVTYKDKTLRFCKDCAKNFNKFMNNDIFFIME